MGNHKVEAAGIHQGLHWMCVMTHMGHRCGYVAVGEGHPLYGVDYGSPAPGVTWESLKGETIGDRGIMPLLCVDPDELPSLDIVFDVHGSLTFAGTSPLAPAGLEEWWWLGFDCAHAGDKTMFSLGGVLRSQEFVEQECRRLIEQINKRYPDA
jgi:hypothetical protein